MKEVWVIDGVRTAIGSFGGSLKDVSAWKLGIITAKEVMKRAKVQPDVFDDVLVGNCMMRSDEINIARCISLEAGIPFTTPAATIQRQCSSSMQAFVFGAQQIMLDECDAVLIGGVENMSRVPYALYDMRFGARMFDVKATDMLMQGLTDPIQGILMGTTAENLSEKYNISREEQDELALMSHNRAEAATTSGRFKDEIVPVEVPQRKGDPKIFDKDEHTRMGLTMDTLANLKPAFKKGGTVTAGNSSGLNDGGAAMVIMSKEKAQELGLKPMARLVTHAVSGVEPELMGYGPVPAFKKALKRGKMELSDLQLIELNEAFAAQYLACEKLLGLNRDITNVNGSGIALGHPVGATGIRVIISLLHEMIKRDLTLGAASMCVGGGMGKVCIFERI